MAVTTLRGYTVLDKIKDGSVGTVWRAKNGRNQIFALKQISAANASQSRKLRQFEREAKITRGLRHRNIIRLYDYQPVKPQPFFVMEYFESENLKYSMWHLAGRVQKLEFYILRQVAEALAYVHSLGIIHKDLKPENVLVSEGSEVRLIDFSLAKTKWDRLLQFGRKVEGTPLYMAPEQVRGERGDQRTDVYAFGLLAYELLTKRTPFLASHEVKVMQKHVGEAPPPMRSFVKTLSPDLDQFVLRMLEKRPEKRFPDMTAVIYELSRWEKKDTVVRLKQVAPPRNKAEMSSPLEVPSTA